MRLSRYFYSTAGIAVCLLAACQKQPSAAQQDADVVARIGTVSVTQQDIQDALPLLDEKDQKFANTSIGLQNLVQILTREKLILQDAQDSQLSEHPKYRALLAQKRAELDKEYEQFAQRALVDFWYEQKAESQKPGEKEIKEYFDKYPYEMTIKQIIVDNAQTADQVLRTLKSSPGRWKEISRQHSIAPESLQTLTFMPGEYLSSLEVIAANSPVGKVQGFFKTPQGFHIIMKTNENRLSFEKAAPRIEQILENQHMDNLLDTLKTKYEVIIYDKNE